MIVKIRRIKVMIKYTVEVYADGDKYWYLNGKLHREDGPAVEWADGYKSWYLNGTKYDEYEFNEMMNPSAKELSVSEISKLLGYEVKVVK